jgi:hypothetical protein
VRALTITCFAAASVSVSCATHVGDIPAYGAVWAISRDDLRAATIACHKYFPKGYTACSIRSIDVAGHNTLTILAAGEPGWTRQGLPTTGSCPAAYYEMRRINGTWRCTESYSALFTE